MNPTRSSDAKAAPQTQPLKLSNAARAARAAQHKPSLRDALAESAGDRVELSSDGLDRAGRREVARLDEAALTAIHDAVQDGSYRVDPEALADRLLDDAFGD